MDTRPLRHRAYRNLWLGHAVSTAGGMIGTVAVPYQMYALTHSTVAVGLLGLAALLPLLVVPLIGGAIADAGDRRAVLLRTEVGMAGIAALFLANAALPHPRVWALFALEAAAVAIYSLGRPAFNSLRPRLVPPEELTAAQALDSVYESLAAAGGPAVAGLLIATVGLSSTYAIDLATYVASLVAIAALPRIAPHEDAQRGGLTATAIREGFAFVRTKQALLGIFAVDSTAMVFGMPQALFPALALHVFGGGARTVGYLYAAPYAGALVGSLFSGWVSNIRRQGVAVVVLASLWGVAIVGFGLVHPLWAALLLLAFAGGFDFYSAVLRGTMVMQATPDHLRGRVSGIEFMQVASAPNLGNVEAGVVAALTSLRVSVVSGGVVCVIGCVATLALLPRFRRYEAP